MCWGVGDIVKCDIAVTSGDEIRISCWVWSLVLMLALAEPIIFDAFSSAHNKGCLTPALVWLRCMFCLVSSIVRAISPLVLLSRRE